MPRSGATGLARIRGLRVRGHSTGTVSGRRGAAQGRGHWRATALALLLGCLGPTLAWAQATAVFSYAESVVGGSGLNAPNGENLDRNGNLYIADTSNNRVLKVPPTDRTCATAGDCTPLVTSAGLKNPYDVAIDSGGNLYVADYSNARVLRVPATDLTCATPADCTMVGPTLSGPISVALDASNNVYITDHLGNAVWKVPTTDLTCATPADCISVGSALTTTLNAPFEVRVDPSGNVYIADGSNNRVLKVPQSDLTCSTPADCPTIAGSVSPALNGPFGVAPDANGNVYISDATRVLRVPPQDSTCALGDCTTVGSVTSFPVGLATFRDGNVYVADYQNNRVVREQTQGVNYDSVAAKSTSAVQTLTFTFTGAGTLSAVTVLTLGSTAMDFADAGTGTCDTNGTSHSYSVGDICTVNVSVTPALTGPRHGAVELEDASGKVIATAYTYVIGTGPQVAFAPATQSLIGSGLNFDYDVAVDGGGNMYIADGLNNRVLKVPPSDPTCATPGDCTNVGSGLRLPSSVVVDGGGNVYIADHDNSRVLKVPPSDPTCATAGDCITVGTGLAEPSAVAVDGSGNVYIADQYNNRVVLVLASDPSCSIASYCTDVGPAISLPSGVAVDGSGDIFIGTTEPGSLITEVPPYDLNCTVPADCTSWGSGLNVPLNLAVDGSGNLYIADEGNNRVLKVPPFDPTCTTASDCATIGTGLQTPSGVAVDSSGNVYIADTGNNRALKVDFADAPSLTFASTQYGQVSSDSPQTVTVYNIGGTTLLFPVPGSATNPSVSTNFTLGAGTCPIVPSSATSPGSLAGDASCTLLISFAPQTVGSLVGTVVLTDNSVTSASQTISLSGTATQAPQTISFPALTGVTYGVAPITLSAAASSGLAVTFSVVSGPGTVSGTTLTVTGAGTIVVAANQAGNTDYSAAPQVTQSLTVATATLTATANNASRAYGQANPAFSGSLSGAVNGDTFTVSYSTTATTTSAPGGYPIVPTVSGAKLADYTVTAVNGTLTVTQATQTISFPAHAGVSYGVVPFALTATASSALPVAFSIVSGPGTLSGSTLTVTGPGTITVAANQAGNADYTAAPQVTQSIVVSKATLTATANSTSRPYDTPNPTFSGSLAGAVNGDTFTVSYSTTATESSAPGSYAIVPAVSGAKLADYTVNAVNGTLTITVLPTSTALSVSSTLLPPGTSLTLTAQVKSSTGLTPSGSVEFRNGTTVLATVPLSSGTASYTTTTLPAGAHSLNAVYVASTDFSASTSASVQVSVAPLNFTLVLTSASSETVTQGGTASYALKVAPTDVTYPGTVTFAASGLPSGGSAIFSPSSVAATAGPQPIAMHVQTPAAARNGDLLRPGLASLATLLLLWPLAAAPRARAARRRERRLWLLIAVATGALALLTACAPNGFTGQQTYNITVTATSGSTHHSVTVSLSVQ